jgi:hypothetical protein
MTLTDTQLSDLVSRYAEELVDKMDLKTMEQFVYDTIVNNVECMEENDLLNEISLYFDDEDLAKMLTEVGADPDTIL